MSASVTPRAKRTRNITRICAVCTGICLLLFALPPQWPVVERFAEVELRAKDILTTGSFRPQPDPRLVFIGIDQTTYADAIAPEEAAAVPALAKLTNSFPWSRDLWADVVERLAQAGAKAVVLDLVFASPGSGDGRLRAVLDRYASQVVIGANATGGEGRHGTALHIVYPSETVLNYQATNAMWSDNRVGFINFFSGPDTAARDVDDVVRRAIFRISGNLGLPPDGTIESLASRALRKLGVPEVVPDNDRFHLFRYVGEPGRGFTPIPLYTIFLPEHWTNNFASGKFFEGKIVLVGPASNLLHDEHRTPFNAMMLGPEIHLNVMSAALRGEFLKETSTLADFGLITAMGSLALLLAIVITGPVRRMIIVIILGAAYWALCYSAVRLADFVTLAVMPLMAFGSSSLVVFSYDFVLLRLEKNRTRRTLERYVSKDVVREVLDNPQTFLDTLGGRRRPVTILFSDVRGFTTMTEGADVQRLVAQLNEYFNAMVETVYAHQGSLDKFIGDAVMALWGNIVSQGTARDAQNAVATALSMRRALARLNVSWQQRGIQQLSFGIGINHGEVIVGNLGSEQKMEVSVIGDPVNLASRLEGLTKEYKLDLLLGESMVPLVQERFALRSVDSVQVKGKRKPVHVFTVVADKEAGELPPAWLERYEEGISHYRAQRFNDGLAAFADCLRQHSEDFLSQLYLNRCQELVANPPGPDWDTTIVMKSK